jgi:hypothetical protein
MKWIIWVHYAVVVILKLINSFTVLNYGPRALVGPAVLRMPEHRMQIMYAKITFWRQTSQRLKGNDWTEGLCNVAQAQLHKIWFHYLQFYLARRTFMSSHPIEPMASCLCLHPLFRHLFSIHKDSPCTSSQTCDVQSTPPAASMFAAEDKSCPLNLNASDGEFKRINLPNSYSKPRARHSLLRELYLSTVSQFTPR